MYCPQHGYGTVQEAFEGLVSVMFAEYDPQHDLSEASEALKKVQRHRTEKEIEPFLVKFQGNEVITMQILKACP